VKMMLGAAVPAAAVAHVAAVVPASRQPSISVKFRVNNVVSRGGGRDARKEQRDSTGKEHAAMASASSEVKLLFMTARPENTASA